VGCEVADYLAEQGKRITIIEMMPEIPMGDNISMMRRLLIRLKNAQVKIITGAKCKEIREKSLVILDDEGQRQTIDGETVVLAAGFRPNRELCQTIGTLVHDTYVIGDCVKAGRIMDAMADGFRVGLIA